MVHVIADKLGGLSDLLRSLGERDGPWPLRHGRGDGAAHPGTPDRGDLKPRVRDICVSEAAAGTWVLTLDLR